VRAHRAVYQHLRGSIPEGADLDHLCRVRCCVNPCHLEPVTTAVNCRRGASTQLTEDRVAAIREKYARGSVSHQDLAMQYGVSRRQIGRIISYQRWVSMSTPPLKVGAFTIPA
jgi:hypothetical protein